MGAYRSWESGRSAGRAKHNSHETDARFNSVMLIYICLFLLNAAHVEKAIKDGDGDLADDMRDGRHVRARSPRVGSN
jgi:hypothetical protein